MAVTRKKGSVQPGWKWGPFTARVPFYHTRAEWPDVMQGLVVTSATAMALVPLLQSVFGLTFSESIACAMIHMFLFSAGPILFGDPFASGYITPALPIAIAFVVGNYAEPTARFMAMTSMSLDFAAIMFFFGITGLGKKFIAWLPKALKGGIILGASIASLKRVFFDDIETFMTQPISTSVAIVVCLIFAFSKPFARFKERSSFLATLGNLGLLPGFIAAAIVGTLVGEIVFDIQWGFLIPPVGDMWEKASPFYIGLPSIDMFLAALPVALIAYTIAFGDFITGEEMIKDAGVDRPDETVDIDVDRVHYSVSIRNVIMGLFSPFFPSQGVLWTGVQVILVQRWRQGRKSMDSLLGGISSFYLFGLPIVFFTLPIITALAPMMSIALSISLVLTGFACAYVAMAIPETPEERGVALLTGVALTLFAPWLGLLVGILATFLIVGFKKIEHDIHEKPEKEPVHGEMLITTEKNPQANTKVHLPT